jgi:hypothetical protein
MAMTRVPKGTGAGAGTGVSLAAASTGGPTGKVAAGTRGASHGFPGSNKTMRGTHPTTRSAKVERSGAKGQVPNSVIPRVKPSGGANTGGGISGKVKGGFGKDKSRMGPGRKNSGPITSGGGGFGQGSSSLLGGVSRE